MNEKFIIDDSQIQQFIEKGFLRIDDAFPKDLAEKGVDIMWKDLKLDRNDPSTWKQPMIRLNGYGDEPFRLAVNSPRLIAAYDQLVGKDRWLPRFGIGTFPIRFPSTEDPGDTGWHADASFEGSDGSWRININSDGRALLMLFLFSDVDTEDAPTRILSGSHLDVPKILEPFGKEGISFIELAQKLELTTFDRPMELATGKAGTVYLCHPFLIHAAQMHHGTQPRFMAQPPLLPKEPLQFYREDLDYSPVEIAIRVGLGLTNP